MLKYHLSDPVSLTYRDLVIPFRETFWRYLAASTLSVKEFGESELDLICVKASAPFFDSIPLRRLISGLSDEDFSVYSTTLIAIFARIAGAFDNFIVTVSRRRVIITVEIETCALSKSLMNLTNGRLQDCSKICVYAPLIRDLLNCYGDYKFQFPYESDMRAVTSGNHCTLTYELSS